MAEFCCSYMSNAVGEHSEVDNSPINILGLNVISNLVKYYIYDNEIIIRYSKFGFPNTEKFNFRQLKSCTMTYTKDYYANLEYNFDIYIEKSHDEFYILSDCTQDFIRDIYILYNRKIENVKFFKEVLFLKNFLVNKKMVVLLSSIYSNIGSSKILLVDIIYKLKQFLVL